MFLVFKSLRVVDAGADGLDLMIPVIDKARDHLDQFSQIYGLSIHLNHGQIKEKGFKSTLDGQNGLNLKLTKLNFMGIQICPKLGLVGHLIRPIKLHKIKESTYPRPP